MAITQHGQPHCLKIPIAFISWQFLPKVKEVKALKTWKSDHLMGRYGNKVTDTMDTHTIDDSHCFKYHTYF